MPPDTRPGRSTAVPDAPKGIREKGKIGGHTTAARHDLRERGLLGHAAAERRLLARRQL